MLVLRANHTVPVEDLIGGLWADDPPPSAANLVQTYVSAWRKTLEPDRAARGGGDRLVTVGPGYRLRAEPGELDLDQFTQAVASAEAAAGAGDHADAAGRLAEALRLWRGPALADLALLPFHRAAVSRLSELRLQAEEAWALAALRCGNARDVLPAIQEAREREPLRERLCELVMWALFQDGRQGEALAAYEQTRRVLADELGADPGPGLRDMHARVLRHDPVLRPAAAPVKGEAVAEPPVTFVGLLRKLRTVAQLTQEELAEAAGLSPRAVSDLEREVNRTARKDTAELLASALNLAQPMRALFVAAARGRAQADEVLAALRGETAAPAGSAPAEAAAVTRTLPRDIVSFTGRHLELRQEVPAPSAARHNLPAPLTSFLGREQDLARLERLLSEARLVTLTGTGGTGKTRLALEAGARVIGRFPDGVWLAELAGVADPELVGAQVMAALGVRQAGDVPVLDALIYRLRSAELLLVLDNCEHLLDACAQLAGALLRAAPGLRVLATSREPLGIPGEVACPVRPLDLPPRTADAHATLQAPAVRLFLDRGSASRGGADGAVAPVAVAERICRKLDGLPLAIELAAARLATLSAAEIEAHLADRFRFLAYRRPAADPRHQALRAAMDWSYDLLSVDERRVLAELSVFAGTFGLAQAAEVCSSGDQLAALDAVDRLAGKSLIAAEPGEDTTRYRLLDTVRYYAADRLAEASGTDAARRRHAAAFLSLAERERAPAALSEELDNLRAALDWALAHGDQAGPRLARALGSLWLARGLLAEGRHWLERALAQNLADQQLRADLLRLLGAVVLEAGDPERADAVLSECSEVAAAADAPMVQARIRVLRADIRNLQGLGIAETLAECEAAAAVLESGGDLDGLAEALTSVGKLRFWLGDALAGGKILERAIACAQQSGNHRAQMRASHWLAVTFCFLPIPADTGVARAEQLLVDASGDLWAEADLLKPLCMLYAHVGRVADARAAIDRSQSIFAGFGAGLALAESAIPAAMVGLIIGDPVAAGHYARKGYQAFRAMGDRGGLVCDLAVLLANALYDQGRFDEAQQMIDETNAELSPATVNVPWLTQAKLLARRGQFAAARRLVGQGQALLSPTSAPLHQAEVLEARAEVERLAGAPGQAAASLRAALRIYEDRKAAALAERARTTLAGLLLRNSKVANTSRHLRRSAGRVS
jgi:predicted ATPase/DNA-binding SARP family transcriptional activator